MRGVVVMQRLTPPGLTSDGRRSRNALGSGRRHSKLAASTASGLKGVGGEGAMRGPARVVEARAQRLDCGRGQHGSWFAERGQSRCTTCTAGAAAAHLHPRAPGWQAGCTRHPARREGRQGKVTGGTYGCPSAARRERQRRNIAHKHETCRLWITEESERRGTFCAADWVCEQASHTG